MLLAAGAYVDYREGCAPWLIFFAEEKKDQHAKNIVSTGKTPLHLAAYWGHSEAVRLIYIYFFRR
jgi:hypothetical protein